MDAEDILAHALERRIGSVPLGRVKLVLDRDVFDGIRWMPGPHSVNWVERSLDELQSKVLDTRAGREARALLEDDLLDVRITRREVHLE